MNQQEQQVRSFFDRLADTYALRYTAERPFHQQLFTERLDAATEGLPLSQATILDIGAGTGPLYDHLLAQHTGFNYFACDLSEKMMAQSQIPESRRFIGSIENTEFPIKHFDFIFALGLTTYLPKGGLEVLLEFINGSLAPGGQAILSFTNARSWEWRFHRYLRPLFQNLGFRRFLIGQPFPTRAYYPSEVEKGLPPALAIASCQWLSPTLPVASRFFPAFSSALSRRLAPHFGSRLYSDFLLQLTLKSPASP